VVEASLFPGLAVYCTLFYTKTELALRIGYLVVSAALAGACGGLLAYAVGHMDGIQGLSGWRWILIIEGLPSVALGVVTFFVLADGPETAWYLDEEEKKFCDIRLQREVEATKTAREFHWADVRSCFKDWKVWAFAAGQFSIDTILYGISTFLPTIIQSIGKWSTAQVQALTIPCYALGAITYLLVARLSDLHQKRGLYSIIFACISLAGYAVLLSDASSGVHYFGCFLVTTGLFVAAGLPIVWLSNNCPRYGKRTTATGMQLTCGNAAGIMAPFIYLTPEGPRYTKGHAVSLAMAGVGAIIHAILWYELNRLNKQRSEGKQNWKLEGKTEEEVAEMGDES
jgi:sugar phosphate permease